MFGMSVSAPCMIKSHVLIIEGMPYDIFVVCAQLSFKLILCAPGLLFIYTRAVVHYI